MSDDQQPTPEPRKKWPGWDGLRKGIDHGSHRGRDREAQDD